MREFEHDGVKYKLTEREYTRLLKRFDVSKVVVQDDISYIEEQCICEFHKLCSECGLNPEGIHFAPCLTMMWSKFGKTHRDLHIAGGLVMWSTPDADSVAYLTSIRDALLTLKKK